MDGGWQAEAGFVSDTDMEARLWNPRGKTQAEIDERADQLSRGFVLGDVDQAYLGDARVIQKTVVNPGIIIPAVPKRRVDFSGFTFFSLP